MINYKKVLKYLLSALIMIIIFHQIFTYTIPVKLAPFPNEYSYEIENPYKEHQIDDNDINELVSYIKNNKFRRIPQPQNKFLSDESIFIHFYSTSTPPIDVYYTLYYEPFSCIQYGRYYYRLNKEDTAFLVKLFEMEPSE